MEAKKNPAAGVQLFLAVDGVIWCLAALAAIQAWLWGGHTQATLFYVGSGLKVVIAIAWLVWLVRLVERARHPELPSPALAAAAFCVPLVRLVAPGWVMWKLVAQNAPRSRWLVPLWLLSWHLGRLATAAGQVAGYDLVLALVNVAACGLAWLLVRELEAGVATRVSSDRPDG